MPELGEVDQTIFECPGHQRALGRCWTTNSRVPHPHSFDVGVNGLGT